MKVDYLTISVVGEDYGRSYDLPYLLSNFFGFSISVEYRKHKIQGYRRSWDIGHGGVMSTRDNETLFNLGGQFCNVWFEYNPDMMRERIMNSRVTRIDICVDIETDILPSETVLDITKRGLKHEHTHTGYTLYMGSRTSNQYVRIYRYKPPHERHKTLRVEFEYKGTYTEKAVHMFYENPDKLKNLMIHKLTRHGVRQDFIDNIFDIEFDKDITWGIEIDRKTSKTTLWLQKQVKPAIKRLIDKEGLTVEYIIELLFKE